MTEQALLVHWRSMQKQYADLRLNAMQMMSHQDATPAQVWAAAETIQRCVKLLKEMQVSLLEVAHKKSFLRLEDAVRRGF